MTDEATVEIKEKWRWSAFWQRLKRRELVTRDFDVLTLRFFFPLLSPALAPLFLNTEGALGDWFTRVAYLWVAPPVIALFCLLSYCTKPGSKSAFRIIWGIVAPVVSGLLFAYLSIGYFDLANALTGSKEPVVVSGPIVNKVHSTGRTGFNAYFHFLYEGRVINLKVPLKDYDRYNIGDTYSQTMCRGGFGYFYRWNRSKK